MSISAASFRLVVTRIKFMKLRDHGRVCTLFKSPGRVTFPFNFLRYRHLRIFLLKNSYIAIFFAILN